MLGPQCYMYIAAAMFVTEVYILQLFVFLEGKGNERDMILWKSLREGSTRFDKSGQRGSQNTAKN